MPLAKRKQFPFGFLVAPLLATSGLMWAGGGDFLKFSAEESSFPALSRAGRLFGRRLTGSAVQAYREDERALSLNDTVDQKRRNENRESRLIGV
jgi:hypothetical protein